MSNAVGNSESIQPFQFRSIRELYELPVEETSFLVEDLLPMGGVSILAGKPKCGKSTLARQLAVAVAKSHSFLGKPTQQGAVAYLAMEEKLSEVIGHFRALGLSEADPVHIHCGVVQKNQAVAMLAATLKKFPDIKLVIIDTIFKFLGGVKDANDYVQVNNASEKVMELARKHGCHIVMVHHMKKRETDDAMDGILGSTAIAGNVDTYIALKRDGKGLRTISAQVRYGIDMPEHHLSWDSEKRSVDLGQTREEADEQASLATVQRIESDITLHVAVHPNCTQSDIFSAVSGKIGNKKNVLKTLVATGTLLQSDAGVKGQPYTYTHNSIPVEHDLMPTEP